MEFQSRRILITGGGSGIGAAIARQLHREGASVCLFDLDSARLTALAEEFGARVSVQICDVTSEDALGTAFAAVRSAGAIDGLVCCAGVPDLAGPAESLSVGHWSRIIDSHLTGTFLTCRVVGGDMLASGGGAIVNLASVLAFNSGPVLAYGAAKAAVVSLTESLAVQWARRNVRVNAIAPGWTDTPFLRPKERQGERDMTPIIAATPIARLIRPEEIAEVACFLLSPRSSAIVGSTILCDGGVVAASGWPPYGGIPGREAQPA
jgi:NAD(P)-dependent dehydrogenase (short-subunit alcohol dehydrogenase family)